MALVEFQFRKQVFLDYLKGIINLRPLPFPTLDIFLLPQLQGRLLERIECLDCIAEATDGQLQIVVKVKLAIHYHPSLTTIRAAGSLQRPVTEQAIITVPVEISVKFVAQPNKKPPDQKLKPQLQWIAGFGLFPPGIVPLDLPEELNMQSGAVVASEDVIAIRLGTRLDDPVNAPITSRLGNSDWSQLISSQLIVDNITDTFSEALRSSVSGDFELSKAPSGAWFVDPFFPSAWMSVAQAEVNAEDQCIFDIDISVTLRLTAHFEVSGNDTLVTTLVLDWDADSTLCDIIGTVLGTLLITPLIGVAIHEFAEGEASRVILGSPLKSKKFHKIGNTDHSISYQQESFFRGPSGSFRVTHMEVNKEGHLLTGAIAIPGESFGLEGMVTAPKSGLHIDCNKKRVSVQFYPARVYLHDYGMQFPPKLFTPGVLFSPVDAWVAAPGTSNDWHDLTLTFVDPPGGRLPIGTATSVFISTDCGVRWVDLGVIPPDHEEPTEDDVLQMISQCMAINDPWGNGVMNLGWLVDPPDLLYEFEPLRQWTIGARELPEGVQLKFVAVGLDGAERDIGVIGGRQNIAAKLTTTANETLQIRTGDRIPAPAPVVFQRWIIPFASIPLFDVPLALSAADGIIGIISPSGEIQVVRISAGGLASTDRLNLERDLDASVNRLVDNLLREVKLNRDPWATEAKLDQDTVAVVHAQELLIGRVEAMTEM